MDITRDSVPQAPAVNKTIKPKDWSVSVWKAFNQKMELPVVSVRIFLNHTRTRSTIHYLQTSRNCSSFTKKTKIV